jgi:lipoprotein signal peptidase
MTRPSVLVLALIATVVVLDQAAKWWAWRYVPGARINSGGDVIVGSTIGRWYAAPVTGALLDLLDFGVLSVAVTFLMRFRTIAVVAIPGALMIGGWGSNLLDRLGVHYWTAPGSVRGAVDFIHLHGQYYNVADFFIISCTPVFLLAALYQGVRAVTRATGRQVMTGRQVIRSAAVRSALPRARRRVWARVRIPALAAAGLVLVVSLGAAHYGGVNTASCTLTHLDGSAATSAAAVPLSVC